MNVAGGGIALQCKEAEDYNLSVNFFSTLLEA